MRSDPLALLRMARAIIAEPNAKAEQLGIALLNIHSALERHFRTTLSHNNRVPLETRLSVSRSREIDWPQLLVLMTMYGGLSETHGATIRTMNITRNGVAHRGETYRGTRQDLLRYADLAESLITGRERSFAGAVMPDELFDATMASLGRDVSPKQGAIGEVRRSVPMVRSSNAPLPMGQQLDTAPSPQPARADDGSFVRHNQGRLLGTHYTKLMVLILIIAMLLLLFGSIIDIIKVRGILPR